MNQLEPILNILKEYIWGVPLLTLIFGTGAYLTILLKGVQFRYLGFALAQVFSKKQNKSKGDISHFEALMTSLAGAIGTGSIVGVATAVTIGGFGALFWMWVTTFFAMATKYAESLLAVHYREVDGRGEMIGGPMQYIEKGLGWKWLAVLFAATASIAAFGIGNLVQVNSIAVALSGVWDINAWSIGLFLAITVGLVLLGGVKSIGRFASICVPFMGLIYVVGGVGILLLNYRALPDAFALIIKSAFSGQAAIGGFSGAGVMTAVRLGVARSIFSNEAGLGISAIPAAAAKTDSPGRQGLISMTGALVSTLIVCTITGLILAVTNVLGQVDSNGEAINGAALAITAFDKAIYGGRFIVTLGLILFAFTTVIAWAYYGEKCFEYLFGEKSIIFYRLFYTLVVIPGAAMKLEVVWLFADIANACMVFPNLIALIMLSGVIVSETNKFLHLADKELKLAT